MANLQMISLENDTIMYGNETLICDEPIQPGTQFDVIAYGFIYPVLAFIVIVTNCNGVCVLLRMDNFTQTNTLLLSIFIIDMLTTVFPLPKFFFMFTLNWNEPFLPRYPWCFLGNLSSPILPTITNNISIWLVSLLSMQRCLCVRNRELYERVFSHSKIVISIVMIAFLTFTFHSLLLVDKFRWSTTCLYEVDSTTIPVCNEDPSSFILSDTVRERVALPSYYILRILLFHVIPIIAITVSTVLLIHLLFQAQSTMDRLYKDKDRSKSTAAETITRELARIEENEYRNASVNLSERRRRSLSVRVQKNKRRQQANNNTDKDPSTNVRLVPPNSCALNKKAQPPDKRKRVSTTTHMLVIISTIYLIQHIFQSALFVTGLAFNFTGRHTETSLEALSISATVGNLAYLAGFPAAFFLCVFVQEPFRQMFYSIYEDAHCVRFFHKFRSSEPLPAITLTPPTRDSATGVSAVNNTSHVDDNHAKI